MKIGISMQNSVYSLGLVWVLITSGMAADPVVETHEQQKQRSKYVIYASEDDTELASSWLRVLRGKGKVERFLKADTLEKALASDAEVMILVMTQRKGNLPAVGQATLDGLKKRKIIGIGTGAAQLFGRMGLEINLGNCAHFGDEPPSTRIEKSELLGTPKSTELFAVQAENGDRKVSVNDHDHFALFIPLASPNSSVVDVIARWSDDSNYAPIVRQGNCILIGIPLPATEWSETYAKLVQETCRALHDRPLQSASGVRRTLTKPGTYEFMLAPSQSTTQEFDRLLFFRFDEPTKITIRLEHSGSNSVMLLFSGEGDERLHATRQDARESEPLEMTHVISHEDIRTLADRHWTVNVTNFDAKAGAMCKLKITCETP